MKIFENNAKLALANLQAGQLVRTKGGTTAGDGGGRTYRIEASGATGITLANGNVAVDITTLEVENILTQLGLLP
ncbi:hypothetical protein NVP1170O_024 [Vibrio phage 1.170.O._10N.261.52.C3]|nr:hypothetical protein NVP1170O_024 [Vibrio phage 1.170.O._10N.261.52.C3]